MSAIQRHFASVPGKAPGKELPTGRIAPKLRGMTRPDRSCSETSRVEVLALWLLLLSIFTHAIIPAGSPLHRTTGSAFSASTAEVSLAPKRKALADEQVQLEASGDGASEGSGPPDPLDLRIAFRAVPLLGIPQSRIALEAAVATLAGGAAFFLARAPPSN